MARNEHWLVVTAKPGEDDYDLKIECPNPNGDCIAWIQCDDHEIPPRVRLAGSGEVHGVLHQRFNFAWCRDTGQCTLVDENHEWWYESAYDVAERLGAGRHAIDFDWVDEHSIEVMPIEQVS